MAYKCLRIGAIPRSKNRQPYYLRLIHWRQDKLKKDHTENSCNHYDFAKLTESVKVLAGISADQPGYENSGRKKQNANEKQNRKGCEASMDGNYCEGKQDKQEVDK